VIPNNFPRFIIIGEKFENILAKFQKSNKIRQNYIQIFQAKSAKMQILINFMNNYLINSYII